MATVKCNKPDAEDESMLDVWISFHGIKTTTYGRVEESIEKVMKDGHHVFLRDPKEATKQKFWITRIILTDNKDTEIIIYTELPVYIMEDGKTVDRIN